MEPSDSFGEWVRRRRNALGLTRAELATCAGCSVSALRKIEGDERRPSRELAQLLGSCLQVEPDEQADFVESARGQRWAGRLSIPEPETLPPPPVPPNRGVREVPVAPPHATAQPQAPVWNLPSPATQFFGREAELAAIEQLLADPGCRLLTLVGPGGIGKTRLALETACAQWPRFADGVFFASLAGTSSPEFLIPAIAEATGLSFAGPADPEAQLVEFLRQKQALLLLDNLEHLLERVDVVLTLLSAARDLKVLVTSRERLGLSLEWVFEVQGLPVPANVPGEALEGSSAAQLFLQRARQARVDFVLAPEDRPYVSRICRLVEGMPLAIELAATWVPVLTCREIASEIERGLEILRTPLRDVPARHRSLRAVFDHSWKLLTADEQFAMRQVAVFQGGFSRDAAQAVAGAGLPLLSALVAKSLVRRTSKGAYNLHPIVQQAAQVRLAEDPSCEAGARDRHAVYYLTYLREREVGLKSSAQRETMAQLLDELDNLRTAWRWAVTHRHYALLQPVLRCFGDMFLALGLSQEGVEHVELLLDALQDEPESQERQRLLGQATSVMGLLLFRIGDHVRALPYLEESLTRLRPLGEPALLVDPLVVGSVIQHLSGNLDAAMALVEEGLQHARVSGDTWFEAFALFNRGHIVGLSGRREEGYRQMQAGLALWREVGGPRFVSMGLNYTSLLAMQLGYLEEAEAYLQESLALCAEIGDRWGTGTAYRHLGMVALTEGDAARAETLFNRGLEIFRGFVVGWDLAQSVAFLGKAAAARGDDLTARGHFREAIRLAVEANALPVALDSLVGLADLELADGDASAALELCLFVFQHPARTDEIREQCERIRTEAERRVGAEGAARIRQRVGAEVLGELVERFVQLGAHPSTPVTETVW